VMLDRYALRGVTEVTPAALQVPPLPERGTAFELAGEFGGVDGLRSWLEDLQRWLYEDSKTP
jgi:hypothetical protein